MDTAKWPPEFVVKPMNEIVTNTCLKHLNPPAPHEVERKARPEKDQALNCPRCNSLNTKFCYYNNYSLTQPRYFCKDCRRYWTAGGSLRNIPIGGGVRKNKRSSSSLSSSTSSKKHVLVKNNTDNSTPRLTQLNEVEVKDQNMAFGNANEVRDLNLVFSQEFGIGHHHTIPDQFLQVLPSSIKNNPLISTSRISNSSNPRPAFMPFPNLHDPLVYTAAASGFGLSYPQFQEFMRPALGFSLQGGQEDSNGTTATNNGRPLLPFESLKLPVSSSSNNSGGNGNDHHSDHEPHKDGEADQSAGFWNGMLSAGASATSGGGGDGSWQ